MQVIETQTELGNDWYLDRVEVTGPEGVCWVFPCDDWFGRTEDDESIGLQTSLADALQWQVVGRLCWS